MQAYSVIAYPNEQFRIVKAGHYETDLLDQAIRFFEKNPDKNVFSSVGETHRIKRFAPNIYIFYENDYSTFISTDKSALEILSDEIMSHLNFEGETFCISNGEVIFAGNVERFIHNAQIAKKQRYSCFKHISSINEVLSLYQFSDHSDPEYPDIFTIYRRDYEDYEEVEPIYLSRDKDQLEKFARR